MKGERLAVVGTMSGTSLDGVDAAQIVTDGHEIFDFGPVAYRAYDKAERAAIRKALGRWPGERGVAKAARVVTTAHGTVLEGFSDAVLVGFHGQTLAHEPAGRGTHQVGDGAALARALNRPVVGDFRTADVKLGGQGAPLAPFYHYALARHAGATEPLAVLNLGGVGNLTWIDPAKPQPESEGALLAFDTGPANAPIDDLMAARRGQTRDEGGALAKSGEVDMDVVTGFLDRPYFYKMSPKSLDRDDFADLLGAVSGLSDADAVATVTACAAAAVVKGREACPAPPSRLLVTGGGRHNGTLMEMLAAALDCEVAPVEALGFDGDMLEAQAFAYLAARVVNGLPTSCPGTTGVQAAVGGGTVFWP